MTIKVDKTKSLSIAKQRIKKIGRCSLSDIIKTDKLSFNEKIDFIRHEYTYYTGNYDFFYTAKGKPNENKEELNNLIIDILMKKEDLSALKIYNKKIAAWRKERLKKEAEKRQAEIAHIIHHSKYIIDKPTLDLWYENKLNELPTAKRYLDIIKVYLTSEANTIKSSELFNTAYKTLKTLAMNWYQSLESKNGKTIL
jgi:hypothetical protein